MIPFRAAGQRGFQARRLCARNPPARPLACLLYVRKHKWASGLGGRACEIHQRLEPCQPNGRLDGLDDELMSSAGGSRRVTNRAAGSWAIRSDYRREHGDAFAAKGWRVIGRAPRSSDAGGAAKTCSPLCSARASRTGSSAIECARSSSIARLAWNNRLRPAVSLFESEKLPRHQVIERHESGSTLAGTGVGGGTFNRHPQRAFKRERRELGTGERFSRARHGVRPDARDDREAFIERAHNEGATKLVAVRMGRLTIDVFPAPPLSGRRGVCARARNIESTGKQDIVVSAHTNKGASKTTKVTPAKTAASEQNLLPAAPPLANALPVQ